MQFKSITSFSIFHRGVPFSPLKFNLKLGFTRFFSTKQITPPNYLLTSQKEALKQGGKLLRHVVYGEEREVQETLDKNPALLYFMAQVTDYSERKIIGCPFQIALGAEDVEMCYMLIERYFRQLPHGLETALEQFLEQFPDEEHAEIYNFKSLADTISNEIFVDDQLSHETEVALEKFRRNFLPKDVITHGKHFDIRSYLAALETYRNKSSHKRFSWDRDPPGTWNEKQGSLFVSQVIGYLQQYLPACWAQAYCQGLYNVAYGNKLLVRKVYLNDHTPFFLPKSALGRYAVSSYSEPDWGRMALSDSAPGGYPSSAWFSQKEALGMVDCLRRKKDDALNELRATLKQESKKARKNLFP